MCVRIVVLVVLVSFFIRSYVCLFWRWMVCYCMFVCTHVSSYRSLSDCVFACLRVSVSERVCVHGFGWLVACLNACLFVARASVAYVFVFVAVVARCVLFACLFLLHGLIDYVIVRVIVWLWFCVCSLYTCMCLPMTMYTLGCLHV